MQVTQLWVQCLIGAAGGIACEALHWYSLSRKPEGVVAFSKSPVYWVVTIAMILIGAGMPPLYLQGTASALLCFHLGAATPVLLQKLVAAAPAINQGQGGADAGGGSSLRRFFSW
jgi:hypothetical protein